MPYVIQTFDKPDHAHVRTANRAVHLDYLEKQKGKLLAAGALLNDDGRPARAASSSSTPKTARSPMRSSPTIPSPRPVSSPRSR